MLRKLVTSIFLFPLLVTAAPETISIGMLPGGSPLVIEKESFTMADKLQQRIGRPVQVYISKNYTAMIEALKNKKVDFAVLSSMTYVMAEKETELKVLLKKTWSNSPFYYSAIVTNKNSKIHSYHK